MVYGEGNVIRELLTVFEGWAFRYKLLSDGRRQIVAFLLPGDPVVEPPIGPEGANYSVEALTDLRLCVFDRDEFMKWAPSSPTAMTRLRHVCQLEFARNYETITNIGRRNALERVAFLILHLMGRLAERGRINGATIMFPLRQRHLADALGLTVTHINRVLTELRARNLIRLDQSRLTVVDAGGLARLAGNAAMAAG